MLATGGRLSGGHHFDGCAFWGADGRFPGNRSDGADCPDGLVPATQRVDDEGVLCPGRKTQP